MQRMGQPLGVDNPTLLELVRAMVSAWQARVKENLTERIVIDVKDGVPVKIQTFPFVDSN